MNRVDELNNRLYSRNVPSSGPPLLFDPRPVTTKFIKFPVLDEFPKSVVPLESKKPVAFLPCSGLGPQNGFCPDRESELKGIVYPLVKDDRFDFKPALDGPLYAPPTAPNANPVPQPHHRLFAHVVQTPQHFQIPNQIFNNVRLRAPSTR